MKQIFIFGTGGGATHYLNYLDPINYTILGYLDNDVSKQGTVFHNKTVFSPKVLATSSYDEIHIASMWCFDIKKQLIQQFSVPNERIFAVSKHNLKSGGLFGSERVQKLAKRFIHELCLFCKNLNLPLFLADGSLLGIIRDQKLIPWDDDIDFIIQNHYVALFTKELPNFLFNCTLKKSFNFKIENSQRQIVVWLTAMPELKINQIIPVCFTIAYMQEQYALTEEGRFYIPNHFLSAIEWIDLHPGKASTFNKPKEFLTLLYRDWLQVRKNFEICEYGHLISDIEFNTNNYLNFNPLNQTN